MASPQEFVVMGADVNTQISWTADGDTAVPRGTSTKFQNVLNLLSSKNMAAVAQEDPRAHNHWIRKAPSAGFQIDIVASSRPARCKPVTVHPGSRAIVGTDHEQRSTTVITQHGGGAKRRQGGPRVLSEQIPAVPRLDQTTLRDMAEKFTKPAPALKFVPSNAVRVMGRTRRPELIESETKELNGDMRSGMMRPETGLRPMG